MAAPTATDPPDFAPLTYDPTVDNDVALKEAFLHKFNIESEIDEIKRMLGEHEVVGWYREWKKVRAAVRSIPLQYYRAGVTWNEWKEAQSLIQERKRIRQEFQAKRTLLRLELKRKVERLDAEEACLLSMCSTPASERIEAVKAVKASTASVALQSVLASKSAELPGEVSAPHDRKRSDIPVGVLPTQEIRAQDTRSSLDIVKKEPEVVDTPCDSIQGHSKVKASDEPELTSSRCKVPRLGTSSEAPELSQMGSKEADAEPPRSVSPPSVETEVAVAEEATVELRNVSTKLMVISRDPLASQSLVVIP